ncbi:MAG: hypothetical protein EPN20_20355 [Magnetospirillum sp.]|nr:MAG: hypothetical protein EPN20_20355 [Magnetospirillum sp.]
MPAMPISRLDTQALQALAEFYESALRDIRWALKDRAEAEARKQASVERRKAVWSTGPMVAAHMDAGVPLEQAKLAVVRETGMDHDLIHMAWRKFNDRRHKELRAIEVARLARRGLTNDEIARKVGLKHPGSVSRILKSG